MNILAATKSYESWSRTHIPVVEEDLKLKHERMREGAFFFLRATFYRWLQLWDGNCQELLSCPKVLAVGDLHIENFGTWRDADGRLVWGINDFDEAFSLPYALDLVRLGVSVALSIRSGEIAIKEKEAISEILSGYGKMLKKGGEPFVLEERHSWLRSIAVSEMREPDVFWEKMTALHSVKRALPGELKRAIEKQMPERGLKIDYYKRTAGLGSLGRRRVVGLATWRGGYVAREAKNSIPSAGVWHQKLKSPRSFSEKLVKQAVRMPDPFWTVRDGWVVRRLAPHCGKIEIGHLPKKRSELQLLHAMGAETANIHLGDLNRKKIVADFTPKRQKQIIAAIDQMTELTLMDWNDWRRG